MSAPPDLLDAADDGGKGGQVLLGSFKGGLRIDAGRLALPHHSQGGGGCSDAALGGDDGGERGRAGRVWTRG